ncbi:uncharacterized protein NPIL_466311 [Nephila pilipes]|uniref:Reverse transcriptase domain-containing protein n=1 Tax=Nephila pilipes TaxID=299642 RepID=A0A8X6T7H0_NEPPI|nr:uncharacterized protein NPIL_466311 [Nephila pilipes]
MKLNKSPGPVPIFAEFIHHTGEKARKTLLMLFNKIWKKTDAAPSLWGKGNNHPFLKKDKTATYFNSYRLISFTYTLAKLMKRLVTNRLKWHNEIKELLHHAQGGLRKPRSTEELDTTFSQCIKNNLDKSNSVGAIFVDFKEAYDTV